MISLERFMFSCIKKIAISTLLTLATIGILIPIDRGIGKFITKRQDVALADIFLLPPNTKVVYKTPELTCRVETNSMGYRGRDYPLKKDADTIRILAIGDSFTFGWGVNLKDSWPDLTEKSLHSRYPSKKFEVINLGKSGLGPDGYLQTAKEYIPYFKPDFVFVGVLEGDDFGQLISWPKAEKTVSSTTMKKREQLLKELEKKQSPYLSSIMQRLKDKLTSMYPNLFQLVSRYQVIDVKPTLLSQMRTFISNASDRELERLEKGIKPEVRNLFMEGGLNPILFSYAVSTPNHFVQILNQGDSISQDALQKFTTSFKELADVGRENGTKTILVDIPYGIFVSEEYMRANSDIGFSFIQDAWKSDVPMEVTRNVADSTGAFFIPAISEFRKNCLLECFYRYDGHMKPKGNRLLAKVIVEKFVEMTEK